MLASRPPLSARARAFREALRLPVDQPVVMSGHQATVWHPGILAKYLAAAHAREAFSAAAAWVVVDQDPEDFTTIRVPVRLSDRPGGSSLSRLEARDVRLIAEDITTLLATDHAPCALGPVPVRDGPAALHAAMAGGAPATDSIAPGVEGIARAVRDAGQGTISAAQQVAAAVANLVAPIVPPLPNLFASALARTEFVGWLLSVMRDDPQRCARAYNDAVAEHPGAGIAPLASRDATNGGPDVELPLWRISPTEPRRRRVWASEIATVPRAELAPRALLLTAILRLGACDLFIHGTGGGGDSGASGYDGIMEAWIAEWLGIGVTGSGPERMAPMATVSATLLLPLADADLPEPAVVARARWAAHHARHDGAFLGPEVARVKSDALAVMTRESSRAARREAYTRMHHAIANARDARAADLASLDRQAAALAEQLIAGAIAHSRTWAFPLYSGEALARLSAAIRERLGRG